MGKLNTEQDRATRIIDGSALILAGAGSGKTTVISHRVLNLIQYGVSPRNILTLTFTNKAAKEMKERIAHLTNGNVKSLKIMTFHSLGVYILRHYGKLLGLKSQFNIYGDYDKKKIFHDIYKDMAMDAQELDEAKIQSKISMAKNNYISWEQMEILNEEDKLIQDIYKRYQEKMLSYSAFDFDDLIFQTLELFHHHPKVLEECRRLFGYVMIDEYQDTNRAQYLMAKKICEEHGNIFAVGDDDQSIYGWRGADIRNILNFKEDFPSAQIIKLEENYRSTNFILKAANSLIGHNENRHDKNLYSRFEDGRKIATFQSLTPKEEAKKIADEILMKRLSHGCSFRDFAILFRTNSQSKIFEDVFMQENVPFVSTSQFDLYERKEIKDVMAYLRLLNNSDDDLSFLRVINFPKRGIMPKLLKQLNAYSIEQSKSLYECLAGFQSAKEVPVEMVGELNSFVDILDRYRSQVIGKDMYTAYEMFLDELGFVRSIYAEEDEPERAEKRVYYLEQFNDIFKRYIRRTPDPNISDFLQKLAIVLYGEKDKEGFDEDAVNLLTIHSAKGLEYDYVYVVGMEEGMLPFKREGEEMNVDEERRLAYVAITRAKKELTLSLSVSRQRDGQEVITEPSRFLDEIDSEVINRNYGGKKDSGDDDDTGDLGTKTFSRLQELFKDD